MNILNSFNKNSIARDSLVYTVSDILIKILPFLLIPFYTNNLKAESYGKLAMFIATISILIPLTGISTNLFIFRKFFDTKNIEEYISSSIIILLIHFLIISSVFAIFQQAFCNLLGLDISIIYLAILIAFFESIILIKLSIFQSKRFSHFFSILQISRTFLMFVLTLFFLLSLKYDYKSRVYAYIIISFLYGTYSILSFKIPLQKFTTVYKVFTKEVYSFGLPYLAHEIGKYIILISDRFLIKHIFSDKEVGLYFLPFQIALVITFFSDAINRAFSPYVFSYLKSKNYLALKKIELLYYIIMIVSSLLFYFFTMLISDFLFVSEYKEVSFLLKFLCLGFFLRTCSTFSHNYFQFFYKTKFLGYITTLNSGFYVVINYFLYIKFGLVGGTYGLIIVSFITLLIIIAVRKYFFNKIKNSPSN